MAGTKVASIFVYGLESTGLYCDHFVVECYSDSGLTNRVGVATSNAAWQGSFWLQTDLISFDGLTKGTTYWLRAGVVAPISGLTIWSVAYSEVAGAVNPPVVTYSAQYHQVVGAVSYVVTPSTLNTDIDHYEAYWNFTGTAPSASQVPCWKGMGSTPTTSLQFPVTHAIGSQIYVWMRAVNTSMDASAWTALSTQQTGIAAPATGSNVVSAIDDNLAAITVAKTGVAYSVPGWLCWQGYVAGGCVDVGILQSGTRSGYVFKLSGDGTHPHEILKCPDYTSAGFSDNNWTVISNNYTSAASFTGWLDVECYVGANGYMAMFVNGVLVCDATDTTYQPSGSTIYGYEGNASGKIAPGLAQAGGSTFLNKQGSMVPAQSIAYTYSTVKSTGSNGSITVTWTAQTVQMSDGSTISVAAGSATFSGLAVATYYLYPYISLYDLTLEFANGATPPTSANAVDAMVAASDGHIPLDPLQVAVASGTGGGGGGGGGGGCPDSNELVDVLGKGIIPVRSVVHGDYLKGYSFTRSKDVYRRVLSKSSETCAAWRVIDGHKCSACESVWRDGVCVPAFRVSGAVFDGSVGAKVRIHVDTDEDDECNYWLFGAKAPLLIHNYIMHS